MLLVLLIHFTDASPVYLDSLYTNPLKSIVLIELNSLSSVCVNCFVLISGYFSIKWKFRSLGALVFQVLFWSIIGVVIAASLKIQFAYSIINSFTVFFKGRWFVPAYMTLYVIAPILNKFIEVCTEKELGKYIVLFYVYSCVMCYLCKSEEFNRGMSFINLIGVYLIGAYLKRSTLKWFKTTSFESLMIYGGLSVFLSVLSVLSMIIGFAWSPQWFLNPIVIVMSVYLFLFFKNLDIGEIKIVNYIAASAFAVYLFHMHPYIMHLYFEQCRSLLSDGLIVFMTLPLFFCGDIYVLCYGGSLPYRLL